nr:centromere protein O [Tanacetum cinerariifolium]
DLCLDTDQWNDGLLATIRERVHMEAARKAMLQSPQDASMLPMTIFHEKITYRIGTKALCCLEGSRIGIQYDTYFAVANLLKRHGELTERLSRDSDKTIFDRLQREFEAVHASQTQDLCLDTDQWNDGLLATIRERV